MLSFNQIKILVEELGEQKILDLLSGNATVEVKKYLVNHSTPDTTCNGGIVWKNKEGDVEFNTNQLGLSEFVTKKVLAASKGRGELEIPENMNLLSAGILDFLIKNPKLIPENWKSYGQILFFGTLYSNGKTEGRLIDRLFVRTLSFSDEGWHSSEYWLTGDWGIQGPAAILNS